MAWGLAVLMSCYLMKLFMLLLKLAFPMWNDLKLHEIFWYFSRQSFSLKSQISSIFSISSFVMTKFSKNFQNFVMTKEDHGEKDIFNLKIFDLPFLDSFCGMVHQRVKSKTSRSWVIFNLLNAGSAGMFYWLWEHIRSFAHPLLHPFIHLFLSSFLVH